MLLDNPVKKKIISVIKENASVNEYIDMDRRFEDIGIGSFEFIRIMVMIEEHYDIEFEEAYFFFLEYGSIGDFICKTASYVYMMATHHEDIIIKE